MFGKRIFVAIPALAFGVWMMLTPAFAIGIPAWLRFASTFLIVAGLGFRAWGAAAAGGHTRTAQIEAPRLVTSGPYAYVRNPIYLGTFTLGLGMVGALGDLRLLIPYAGVVAFFSLCVVRAEESFLERTFGDHYSRYCSGVRRFIPRLAPWSARENAPLVWRSARGEAVIGVLLVAIYGALSLLAQGN